MRVKIDVTKADIAKGIGNIIDGSRCPIFLAVARACSLNGIVKPLVMSCTYISFPSLRGVVVPPKAVKWQYKAFRKYREAAPFSFTLTIPKSYLEPRSK